MPKIYGDVVCSIELKTDFLGFNFSKFSSPIPGTVGDVSSDNLTAFN